MKKRKKNKSEEVLYPSSELLQQSCFEDYKRLLDIYDKIYEKVNIALAFCGALLLVFVQNVDFSILSRLCQSESNSELFVMVLFVLCSFGSAITIIWATIQLLYLMRSKKITVFNSIDIVNEEIYK